MPPGYSADLRTLALLALAPAVGLGLARFAYALVLPDMRADLGWSYVQAGSMNTVNALGYLVGAAVAARLSAHIGADRTTILGLAACVAALAFAVVCRDLWTLGATRFVAGVGGAFTLVAGGTLAAVVAERHPARAALLVAVFYAGPGFGIAVSATSILPLLEHYGPGSWPIAWGGLAALSLVLASASSAACRSMSSTRQDMDKRASLRPMVPLLFAYALFGAGYIAYMTYMIAWLRENGASGGQVAAFWSGIGLAAMMSPWLWSGLMKRGLHGRAFSVLTAITAGASALPLLASEQGAVLVSAALFGSAFFTVVAATTTFVRRNVDRSAWTSAIGALTFMFGLGQTLGPVGVGVLSDARAGLSIGLWASTAALAAASLISLFQRDWVSQRSGE